MKSTKKIHLSQNGHISNRSVKEICKKLWRFAPLCKYSKISQNLAIRTVRKTTIKKMDLVQNEENTQRSEKEICFAMEVARSSPIPMKRTLADLYYFFIAIIV
jgi:hypothetical protein